MRSATRRFEAQKSLAVARCAILKEMKYYWRLTELEIYVEMVLGEEWRLIKAFAEADGGSHEVRSPKDSRPKKFLGE